MSVRIAVIGDVHLHFNDKDVSFFNKSDYDLILFVGDLVNYVPWKAKDVWALISKLQTPTLFMPGNHDSTNIFQLIAEVLGNQPLAKISGFRQSKNAEHLKSQLKNTTVCGYSKHSFNIRDFPFDIIAARPYSMGGPNLSFQPFLKDQLRIDSMQSSAERIKDQIDASQNKNIVFLAHNGPTGLGDKRHNIWGCDFRKSEGDFGDPDLENAIEYARLKNKRILAVLAGHMHQGLKRGGERQWLIEANETTYVNAARVPRIFQRGTKILHHHVRVELSADGANISAEEINME